MKPEMTYKEVAMNNRTTDNYKREICKRQWVYVIQGSYTHNPMLWYTHAIQYTMQYTTFLPFNLKDTWT